MTQETTTHVQPSAPISQPLTGGGILQRRCKNCEQNASAATRSHGQFEQPIAHSNGLPKQLRLGLEKLSGIDLSNVRVHSNSSKPAQVGALAYTQGQDIYLGPSQQKHLPHEGWHAVQQMQNRVHPTTRTGGVAINSDSGLEQEADLMGAKAATLVSRPSRNSLETGLSIQAQANVQNSVTNTPVLQKKPAAIDTIVVNQNTGKVTIITKTGNRYEYPIDPDVLELPTPFRASDPEYQSGDIIHALHKSDEIKDEERRRFKANEDTSGFFKYNWGFLKVPGQPNLDKFPPGAYKLIFRFGGSGANVTQGENEGDQSKGQGKEGKGRGKEGEGEGVQGEGTSETPGSPEGKQGGQGQDGGMQTSEQKLNDFLKKVGKGDKDVDGTPLTDAEKQKVRSALGDFSTQEEEQFLKIMDELADSCASKPDQCPGRSLAELLEFYKNLDEADREALSINQILKADPTSDSDELPEEVLLTIETTAENTASSGRKVQEINQNLALIQSKITDPAIKKDLEPIDLSKLSELNTLLMLQGMLAGGSERLPEVQSVAIELMGNMSRIHDFILEEIAWLAGQIAASILFSVLTSGAGAASIGLVAIRLNKLRKLILKLQALSSVVQTIQGVISQFQAIRQTLKRSDDLLATFEEKRAKLVELQKLLNKGDVTPDIVQQLEDAEDELLELVLGNDSKEGLLDKLEPVMDKFYLPDDLTDDELKQLIFDIPEGIEALDDMLAYKRQVEAGNADHTVTLSLKGFRAGYLLAPFVGFLSDLINTTLTQILQEQGIAERLLGFGGRRRRGGGKFKGSTKKPKARLKAVKTNKQKRKAAADKKKAEEKKKDDKKDQGKKQLDDSSLKWNQMKAEIQAIGKDVKEQGGTTKADIKKRVTLIIGKPDYQQFNAKLTIEDYAKDPALNRIRVEARNTSKTKKSAIKPSKGRKTAKKPRKKNDILVLYLRPELERHKSINKAIRETFKNWPDSKSDKKDAIVNQLETLRKKYAYPVQFRYPSISKQEKGVVKVEAEEISGDIIAWKIVTSLRSGQPAEIIRIERPGSYWGSKKNPILLDWKKPAITDTRHYEPIYIGPYVAGEARVTQQELKEHKPKSKAKRQALADDIATRVTTTTVRDKVLEWKQNPEIKKYEPRPRMVQLPKPSRTILGIADAWTVVKSKLLKFVPREDRGNARGSTLTGRLALFGFVASDKSKNGEGKDGDHVWEIQVGGPDNVQNMWPLESGLNQRAGGELERATVIDPDGKVITMKKLKQQAKKNIQAGKDMWIKIKSTR